MDFLAYTLRCPVCNAELFAEIPLGAVAARFDSDFRPVFDGPDPIAAQMHACPSCRYAGYARAFERSGGGDRDENEELDGIFPPRDPLGLPRDDDLEDLRRWIRQGGLIEGLALEGRDPLAAERYLLAARCREYLEGGDARAVAELFLRGAWCARAAQAPALERSLLLEAEARLSLALDEGNVPASDQARTMYVAGELARRAGEFGKAVDLLGQVEGVVDLDDTEDVQLFQLTGRQLALASMKSGVNATLPSHEELEAEASEGRLRERKRTRDDDGGDLD